MGTTVYMDRRAGVKKQGRLTVLVVALLAGGLACERAETPRLEEPPAASPEGEGSILPRIEDPAEEQALATSGVRAHRDGYVLRLETSAGWVDIEDAPEEGSPTVFFSYRDFYGDVGFYLLEAVYYEGGNFVLVSAKDGALTHILGEPVFSADRSRFLSVSMDLEAGYSPTALQVWRVDEAGLVKEYEYYPEAWGPSDPEWVTDGEVAFTRNVLTFDDEDVPYAQTRARLLRVDDAWTLVAGDDE